MFLRKLKLLKISSGKKKCKIEQIYGSDQNKGTLTSTQSSDKLIYHSSAFKHQQVLLTFLIG